VGILVVNCSLFNPTPSLSAAVMNHFKMGSNTINYNLGGMGCSGARRADYGARRGCGGVRLVGVGCGPRGRGSQENGRKPPAGPPKPEVTLPPPPNKPTAQPA
jgi:hypothetical protein